MFRTRTSAPTVNLLDLRPSRALRWETGEGGRVTLLVPRFRGTFGRRWVQPVLHRPDMRVRLDELGSFVWSSCDGTATVGAIGEAMIRRFGHDPDDAYRRLGMFVRTLARDKFLLLEGSGASAPEPASTDTNDA